jgi:hypothetical protein
VSTDPEMGPKLRDADTPQRFEFRDLDLVVNVAAGDEGEPPLGVVGRRAVGTGDRDDDGLGGREPLLPGKENIA